MRHLLCQAFLVLAISTIVPAHAEAGLWDLIDELNGPGPSSGRFNFMANIFCSGSPSVARLGRLFQIPRESGAVETCLYLDQRWFHADEDSRFYPVNLVITEVGPSIRLHPGIELGAGIGLLRFNSEHGVTGQEFPGTRFTISFPRLIFKPFLAAPKPYFRSNPDWGFFQIYFRETIVVGELTEGDFASKPGTTFSRRHQRVKSMGFIIDVPSGLRLLRRAF